VTADVALVSGSKKSKARRASNVVLWLTPAGNVPAPNAPAIPASNLPQLVQRNKSFEPHVLVVPVGSVVEFPNRDPFFHNVFSLFEGKRFDLGLYEAGTTRNVVFDKPGISYIFCNIHSEMSAVVISLITPLYGFADSQGVFRVENIPNGDYNMHVWIEGQKQSTLDRLARRVRVSGEKSDLGEIHVDHSERQQHLNKFGQSYEPDAHPIY